MAGNESKRPLGWLIGVLILAGLPILVVYLIVVQVTDRTAHIAGHAIDRGADALIHGIDKGDELVRDAGRVFARILNLTPVLSIQGNSVMLENSSIAELAIVARKSRVVIRYDSSFFQSHKILIVSGDFLVKAGYNLQQPFHISIDKPTQKVLVDFPEPEILSVELQKQEILFAEDGWINHLSPDDSRLVIEQLLVKARQEATHSDLCLECKREITTRVEDLFVRSQEPIEMRFHPAKPRN